MPTISVFFGIVIQMYFYDHTPPHFHASYGDQHGMFDIERLEMLKGNLSARGQKLVLEWATLHQAELLENWRTMQTDGIFKKIPPLG